MKYASVYARKGRDVWYISYLDSNSGKRVHTATVHRTDDPSGRRRAFEQASELSKKALALLPNRAAESWAVWTKDWIVASYQGKTQQRYLTAWSHLQEFLLESELMVPRAVLYVHAGNYLEWRTSQVRRRGSRINFNTALTELKVLGVLLREAVRRGFITANPLAQLGVARRNVAEKPEIKPEELVIIREALLHEPVWMRDCFEVAIHQGCRLTETSVPMERIDLRRGTVTFHGKGGKVFTTQLHPNLRPLAESRRSCARLVDLPQMPAKAWHSFFQRIQLSHLCFHSTRVTVITQLARSGVPQGIAQSYVGHASETVHRAYQRLTVQDLSGAVAAIGASIARSGGPGPIVRT